MGGLFSKDGGKEKLTRGEKFSDAKIVKLERDTQGSQLGTIEIQDQPIRDKGVVRIAEYLEKDSCKCDRLVLKKNNAASTGTSRLGQSLALNKTLTYLCITDNKMGDQMPRAGAGSNAAEQVIAGAASVVYAFEAAGKMAAALKKNTTLTTLKLEENVLGNEGLEALAGCLAENSTLTDVAFVKNEISDKGVGKLAAALESNTSLRSLSLEENNIHDEGGEILCAALEKNRALTEVNLRANLLTAAVCARLVSMLKINKNLLELNLRRNNLKDEGCSILAKGLEGNGTVKRLYLSSNLIGCTGIMKFAESLEKNDVLEELYLEINNIEDTGCIRLAEAFEKPGCSLKKVDLSMNNFDFKGYQRLAQAVDKNRSLEHLKLSNSIVSSKEQVKHINSVLQARAPHLYPQDVEEKAAAVKAQEASPAPVMPEAEVPAAETA